MQTLRNMGLLLLALTTFIACGEDKTEDKIKVTINGDNGSARLDAEVSETDAGIENDAAMPYDDMTIEDDMMLVETDAEIQIITIADLGTDEWTDFCNRLMALPEALNITDEDLQFGYCVAQYNEVHEDYFAVSPAECGAKIFDCIDSLQDEYTLPLGICSDANAAPEDCAITPVELESCIRSLLDAQQEMGTQDVCAPEVESAAAFRTTFQRYKAAKACLTTLTEDCPAL